MGSKEDYQPMSCRVYTIGDRTASLPYGQNAHAHLKDLSHYPPVRWKRVHLADMRRLAFQALQLCRSLDARLSWILHGQPPTSPALLRRALRNMLRDIEQLRSILLALCELEGAA